MPDSLQPATPESPATLANTAFERLRTAITSGDLAPGSKLSEPQISLQYGISRGPLREAIRRLEGCKLVEIRPNAGARVVSLNRAQALEIYEIREALEGLACRLAAAHITPEGVAQLRELLARHEAQIQSEDGRRYYQQEGDLDFHYLIVQLSGNRRLFDLLCGELYHLLRLYRAQTSDAPARPEQAFGEHHRIVDAIEAGDQELAGLLMQRHIGNARRALLARLESDLEAPRVEV
ncbi:MAG: GntR family transcriptional regulator [Gammaproteobacteria bacterium]